MRHFYSLLFYLGLPVIILRLLWRSIKAPQYRQRWLERFGYYRQQVTPNVIWFHAVSVGEAEAVFPLIKKIQSELPDAPILVTTTTPTGSARVQAVLGESVQHVYLPYDVPVIIKRFMDAFKPKLAVIMETELWPNLFNYCGRNAIPLYVINARLSEKSARGYRKLPSLVLPLLANITLIAAQTQDYAERFIAIGAKPEQVTVIGNIKFDLEIPEQIFSAGKQLKQSLFQDRYVWIAASTHKGEEQVFLDAYKTLKSNIPELLLVLVPRHPERFDEVAALCIQNQLHIIRRTAQIPCNRDVDVYLGDTMGELKILYAAADLAFVGGSMVPVGGHNLLEASAVGLPVLLGRYMANFKEIADKVLQQEAAIQCHDTADIVKAIGKLRSDADYTRQIVDNGKRFIKINRGALEKLTEILLNAIAKK